MIARWKLTCSTAALMLVGLLAACVSTSTYDQLNQRLSAEIAQGQVHITRLQGAIKIAVNSELLFPSGGWEMPPRAAQTIAEMAPVLAPMQTAHITVIGYTDNVPIGPELQQQGIATNEQLSLKRAQTVMQDPDLSRRQSEPAHCPGSWGFRIRLPRMTRRRAARRTVASSLP